MLFRKNKFLDAETMLLEVIDHVEDKNDLGNTITTAVVSGLIKDNDKSDDQSEKTATIHFFSGTGNTGHAAKVLKDCFEQSGYNTSLKNIEKDSSPDLDKKTLIDIFMFPIYGFAVPAVVIKYMKRLSKVEKGRKAVILCVGGHTGKEEGFDGAAAYQAEHLLKIKGFEVFFIDFLAYPDDFTLLINPVDETTATRIFKETDEKLATLSEKMIGIKTSINKCNFLARCVTGIINRLFLLVARHFLGKVFIADQRCIGCGKCSKDCPAKAIKMIKKKPTWNYQCIQCNRCINICPQKSIQTSVVRLLSLILSSVPAILIVLFAPKSITELSGIGVIDIIYQILLMILLYIVIVYILDKIINLLEKLPLFRKISSLSYTKKYRRYLAPDFMKDNN